MIEIVHRVEERFYRFWVKHNCIGIDRRYHGRIFELFCSLKEIRDEEGMKVGLTIFKKIIERHLVGSGWSRLRAKGEKIWETRA